MNVSASSSDPEYTRYHDPNTMYPDDYHPDSNSNSDLHDPPTSDEITYSAKDDLVESTGPSDAIYYDPNAGSFSCEELDYDYLSAIAESDDMYDDWLFEFKSLLQGQMKADDQSRCKVVKDWYNRIVKQQTHKQTPSEHCVKQVGLLYSVKGPAMAGKIIDECEHKGCIK